MIRDAFSAIADPTRREIIALLSPQSMMIREIAQNFEGISRQGVSKQIRFLEEAGLLRREKKGREQYCHIQLEALIEVQKWISKYERFWNEKLDSLDAYLDQEPG